MVVQSPAGIRMLVFLKFPLQRTTQMQNGEKNSLNVITKDRVIDEPLRKQISSGKIYIYEKYFSEDQLWHYDNKKIMNDDVISTLFQTFLLNLLPYHPHHLQSSTEMFETRRSSAKNSRFQCMFNPIKPGLFWSGVGLGGGHFCPHSLFSHNVCFQALFCMKLTPKLV